MSKKTHSDALNQGRRLFLKRTGATALAHSPLGSWLLSPSVPAGTMITPAVDNLAAESEVLDTIHDFVEFMYDVRDEHAQATALTGLLQRGLPTSAMGEVLDFHMLGLHNFNQVEGFLEDYLAALKRAAPTPEQIRAYIEGPRYQKLLNAQRYWKLGNSVESEAGWLEDMVGLDEQQISREAARIRRIMTDTYTDFTESVRRYPNLENEIKNRSKPHTNYPAFGTRHAQYASPIPHDYYTGQPTNSWHERLEEQATATSAKQR